MRKMEGEIVTIVLKDSVIPVKIFIKDNDVWVENSFGTSTTYDDVKKHGGKFFEKNRNQVLTITRNTSISQEVFNESSKSKV